MLGSTNDKARPYSAHHHQQPLCTRKRQIGALLLIVATFFFTKLLDRSSLPCSSSDPVATTSRSSSVNVTNGGELWPHRGYGPVVDLKIYVYNEREIDGRDGAIDSSFGHSGENTQATPRIKIPVKEADLFFVQNIQNV